MKQLPVFAISGLHRGESPQPGAAVIRSIRRRYPSALIVGLSYDPLESGLYADGLDGVEVAYSMPFPSTGPQALLHRLDQIREEVPIDFVIPCLDAEIPNYLALRRELLNRGIRSMLPSEASFQRRSKDRLAEFGYEADIFVPRTYVAPDLASAYYAGSMLGYPLIAKGRLYDARKVTSPAEMADAFRDLTAVWGGPALIQQYIAGEEYDVLGVGDGRGGLVGSCSIRKLLLTKSGKAYGGVVVSDPMLDAIVARGIASLKWNGPFEMEFIRSTAGYALIEFNPRFPAWCDFPSQIGSNFPVAMIERATGRSRATLPASPPGRLFIRHNIDLVADISELAELSVTGTLSRSDSSVQEEVA